MVYGVETVLWHILAPGRQIYFKNNELSLLKIHGNEIEEIIVETIPVKI